VQGFSTEAETEIGLAKQSFVAYLVPSDSKNDDADGKGKKKVDDDDAEGNGVVEEVDGKTEEYEWVREYSFRKDQQHSATYFFVWADDSVRYNEIHTKIVLDKIKSQVNRDVYPALHMHAHTLTAALCVSCSLTRPPRTPSAGRLVRRTRT
jgi:hypothetical protein